MTDYSNAQMTRLIAKYLENKLIFLDYQRHKFPTRYSPSDIALLCKTQHSDNEYATIMDKEKTKLFDKIDLKPIDF